MDAVGGGANVIAFLTLAAQTAKLTYEFISAFKNAPKDVEQTAKDIQIFQSVVDDLCRSRSFQEGTSEVKAKVERHVETCHAEIGAMLVTLKGLKISSHEKCLKSVWRRIKFAFKEKSFDEISEIIQRHTTLLILTLNTLQE